MSTLRQTPLYSALHRPSLIGGGDRSLMLSALCMSGILIFSAMNLVGAVSGLIFASVSVYGLRKMAQADPLMRQVYFRQLKYAGYYGPYSRPCRVARKSQRGH